jgi:hypothetical protein
MKSNFFKVFFKELPLNICFDCFKFFFLLNRPKSKPNSVHLNQASAHGSELQGKPVWTIS